ncbi:acyltransferase family protein [Zavarzinia sp. CC-PAN008]|uniref:acyltransferase family protein n=1 Tax=Zavarzinia sp. CC-PAN008 TaxID=3243332 RepID=UPI003F742FD6
MQTALSIQYLRALAAMAVVLFHVALHFDPLEGYYAHYEVLAYGVDVFFVISGFIMWITTCRQQGGTRHFYAKRLARIVPLYWLVTAFMVGVMIVLPQVVKNNHYDLGHAIKSFLFIPAPHPVKGTFEPVVNAGWTLNYEMAFYALFGAMLLLPVAIRAQATVAVLVAIAAFGLLPWAPGSVMDFYTAPIILEFALGVLIGRWATALPPVSARVGWALMLAGAAGFVLVALFPGVLPRLVAVGLPSAAIVLGAVALERVRPLRERPVLHLLGDASYSIYLTNAIVLSALRQAAERLGLFDSALGWAVYVPLALGVAAAAGIACYYLVERPLIGVFRPRPPLGAQLRA